jgi:putative Mn2+ efflux pump MntP
MSIVTIVLLAFGLAMDAFAVSVASGLAIQRLRVHHALRLAVFFGLFQALMPLLGWLAGLSLRSLIEAWDHWIAFVLLSGIGGKMVAESTWMKKEEEDRQTYPHSVYVLLVLSIATSIDALAVGLSLSLLNVNIIVPALAIGGITAVLCFVGTYIGDRFGHLFEQKIEVLGGLILIAIGLRILIQHFMQGV